MTESEVRHRFASRLAAAMTQRGIKASAIVKASKLDVQHPNVNSWRRGCCIPKAHRLIELAGILGVSVGWLLGAEDGEG